MVGLSPLSIALLAAVVTGTAGSILAWRERPEAGATWLSLLLFGQVWWTTFLVFELEATSLGAKTLWYDVQWIGVVVIPVAWLLFALEYTGRDRYVTPAVVTALSVVPAVTLAIAAAGDPAGLLITDRTVSETSVGSFLRGDPGPWYYVIAGYTYLLGLLGSVPILRLISDDARSFRGQSAALLVGTAAPWASSIVHVTGLVPVPGLDPTPLAFAVSGIAYLLALSRFRLLSLTPAPRRRARQLVFEHLHDPAFVVGTEGYVVDLNESAADTFGIDRREGIGRSAAEIVPRYGTLTDREADPSPLAIVGADGRRPYEATIRSVTDGHDRPIGRVVVFHDVGEYIGQQQRLNVLNRVFRHDVRTETNLIHGYADQLMKDPTDERALSVVKESATRILELSEQTRTASELFDPVVESSRVPFDEVIDAVVSDLRDGFSSATVTVEDDFPTVPVPTDMRVVMENLCSNAVRHNDSAAPSVWIGAAVEDGWVKCSVADDGPGIDEEEYDVLQRGAETPLKHGSGMGLWIVKWGVDHVGGNVSFAERDPRGTVVTVSVPMSAADAAESTGRDDDGSAGRDVDGSTERDLGGIDADGNGTAGAGVESATGPVDATDDGSAVGDTGR